MGRLESKIAHALRRTNRVRTTVRGTSERPRLSVFVSNKHVSAQIVDDEKQVTLVSYSSANSKKITGSMSEKAALVGAELGKKAKAKKINKVVFDRGPKLYHGRVKALADAARQEGLEF